VRVADGGMRELSAFIDIQYGQTTDARFDLGMAPLRTVPLPALPAAGSSSPRKSWIRPAAYAGLGVGVASAALAIFLQVKAYSTASDLNRREAVNGLRATDAGSYAEIDRQVKAARGLYVAAAILGAAGGGLLLWDMNAFGIQGKF